MRKLVFCAALALAGTANASEYERGSPDVFQFTEVWAKSRSSGVYVALHFKNATERIIRTMHSTIVFADKTGTKIGSQDISFDGAIIPRVGDRVDFRNDDLERLANIRPDDVTATICTTSVIFQESDVEHFD